MAQDYRTDDPKGTRIGGFMKVMVRVNLLVVSLLFFLLPLQNAVFAEDTAEEVLTNETIVQLSKAGIAQSVIVSKIKASKCNFDTSTSELLRLKKEKVPDEIVNAMVQAMQPQPTPQLPAPEVAADPNDPASPHPPGIYFIDENSSKPMQIPASSVSKLKTGGILKSVATFGVSRTNARIALTGVRAPTQIAACRPTFFIYLGQSNSFEGGASGPQDFILAKPDVKKDSRELTVARMGFRAEIGVPNEFMIPFKHEQISTGIFKLTLEEDLPGGEYGFLYSANVSPGTLPRIFDFGINCGTEK